MPFSQIIPPSLSHRAQKTVLYICVSFAVSHSYETMTTERKRLYVHDIRLQRKLVKIKPFWNYKTGSCYMYN